MGYVILDLEWNGSYSKKLKGFINEIIEFGAVKIDSNMQIIDTFSMLVHPQIGKKISSKVKDLTSISNELLSDGVTYTHALSKFKKFLGNDILMTWATSDILVLIENSKYYLQTDRLDFIKKYVDLQKYCEHMLEPNDTLENSEPYMQMGLLTAAERLNIVVEEGSLHRAYDDSLLSYECFKRLYNKEVFDTYVQTTDDEFYRKITFKNTVLCDLDHPLIDKKEMYFLCDKCGFRAKQKKPWSFKNKAFSSEFYCPNCENEFVGRIRFKLKYDGLCMSKKVLPMPTEQEQNNDNVSAKAEI